MTALIPLSISIHTQHPRMVDDLCRAAMECGSTPETSYVHLAVATALLFVFVIAATVVHLRSAKTNVSEERSRTALEREAFADFARRVAGIDTAAVPTQLISSSGPLSLATKTQSRPGFAARQLDQVTDAYRETIMALPHYEEDYGESLAENMAAELGEELASAVTTGTELTPQLKHALLTQARESFRQRTELLSQIHEETDEIDTAISDLEAISDTLGQIDDESLSDHRFDELRDIWDTLGDLEADCESLVSDRQTNVMNRRAAIPDFYTYLYQSLPVTYPVLNDTLRVMDRVKSVRRQVSRALSHQV